MGWVYLVKEMLESSVRYGSVKVTGGSVRVVREM